MSWEGISCRNVTARKERRCIWCDEPICRGSVYIRDVGRFEGDFQQNDYHPECMAAADTIVGDLQDGFMPGEFKRGTCEERR